MQHAVRFAVLLVLAGCADIPDLQYGDGDAAPAGTGDDAGEHADGSPSHDGGKPFNPSGDDDASSDAPNDEGAALDAPTPPHDANGIDTGARDTGTQDTGAQDTGVVDTGVTDTGTVDTGALCGGLPLPTGAATCCSGVPCFDRSGAGCNCALCVPLNCASNGKYCCYSTSSQMSCKPNSSSCH